MNRFKSQFENYTSEVLLEKRALGDELDDEAHKAIEEIFAERNEHLPAIPSKRINVSEIKNRMSRKSDIVLSVFLMLGAMIFAKIIEKTWLGVVLGIIFGMHLIYKWSKFQLLSKEQKIDALKEKQIEDNAINELMLACADGDLSRVNELLNFGADVNKTSLDGSTALMYASRNNHLHGVRAGVNAGAKIDMKNDKKSTALAIAQRFDCKDVADYLATFKR